MRLLLLFLYAILEKHHVLAVEYVEKHSITLLEEELAIEVFAAGCVGLDASRRVKKVAWKIPLLFLF